MRKPQCFVIMPIGDQEFVSGRVSASELKKRYDDLIREALLSARPNLEVVRADEVSQPGTITTDILTRLMHSDYVVADVTYPNMNVFYELGLRHACRTGTVIIRDRSGPRVPFDIAHLRHIEYENSPSGLKNLAGDFQHYFDHAERNPSHPDNHLQELAKLTNYRFPVYAPPDEDDDFGSQALLAMMQSPEMLQLILRKSRGEDVSQSQILEAIAAHPSVAKPLVKMFVQSGEFQFGAQAKPQRPQKKPPKRKRRR